MSITAELDNIRKFESVGFTHDQAEVLAETREAAVQSYDKSLKEYLDHKFEFLKKDFMASQSDLKSEIKTSQSDLLIKIFGIIFGSLSIAVAILKLTP